jgi:predicted nucleic acid-binding protein
VGPASTMIFVDTNVFMYAVGRQLAAAFAD